MCSALPSQRASLSANLGKSTSEAVGCSGVDPGEGVLAVADHLEGPIPFVIAGHVSIQGHQQREESLVEKHAVLRRNERAVSVRVVPDPDRC